MIYRGYTIISRPHPTPANHSRRGYDIEADGEIIKAVEKIALRPDWLDKLKLLNYVAWGIATGDNTTKT